MTRRLLFSYLSITTFVLLVLEIPLGLAYSRNELDQLTSDLERDARVIATVVEDGLEGTETSNAQAVADGYATRTGARVIVVDADGISVGDTDNPGTPRDFSTRPEIATALTGDAATGTRSSETLGEDIVFVAVPVASGGRVLGAIRITYPRDELDDRIRRNWWSLAALAGVVLVAVGAVGTVLARSVTRPVRALGRAADELAQGALTTRVPVTSGPPELRALEAQFNRMATRLEELVGSQRAFVADASHELRTPLTALRLRLENLASEAPDTLHAEIAAADAEVARLTRLVDGLLRLARNEAATDERELVDLAEEVRERAEAWRALADEHAVRLDVDAPDRVPVLAVTDAVPQILDNLLANALEVAPAQTRVVVRVEVVGDVAALHVVDEGPGLSAEERARAFDRFWRAADAPKGGSGIGLAIVAQLATASGGDAVLLPGPGGVGIDAVVRFPTGVEG
ncbi:MAG TPA: ATP-binding protein [Acidimicrobiia bacterium]|nr:ATP-binding protein [Acidimicrobiia bacterium]